MKPAPSVQATALFVLAALTFGVTARAQEFRATVTGRVTDPNSLATPGSNTRPGLFGVTPPMLVGPSTAPGFTGLSEGCVNAMT